MIESDLPASYDFVVMSHRLPVRQGKYGESLRWRDEPGRPFDPVRRAAAARGGAWLGQAGHTVEGRSLGGLTLHSIPPAPESDDAARRHCSATLSPIYHDCGENAQFRRQWREAYQALNRNFAVSAARITAPGGTVWVHDYHLQLVPGQLRRLRPDLRIGFFLHSPFPSMERFMQMPMRARIVAGLLGADLVGFQQARAANNFLDLAGMVAGLASEDGRIDVDGRKVTVGSFPTSVEMTEIERMAKDPKVRARAEGIRSGLRNPRTVLLSVGPIDHAEGIERRLEAFAHLLTEKRLNAEDTVMIHLVMGGDDTVPNHRLRDQIDRRVAEINGKHARVGHPVIHYVRADVERSELIALYLAADVMIATPLRHGMTLAAKEFVACRSNDTGRLVLSEFTGAAIDLNESFIVNPYDTDALKNAILKAATQTTLRSPAIQRMRQHLRAHDSDRWAQDFLSVLFAEEAAGQPVRGRPALVAEARS